MTDDPRLALIHAEIDGELDEHQRADLARWLLGDPHARSLRDELRQVCARLEALEATEPPADLTQNVLRALRYPATAASQHWWAAPRWRLVAAAAVVLIGIAVLYQVSTTPVATSDAAGTLAARPQKLMSEARIESGPVSGWLRLTGESADMRLQYDLMTSGTRVDMVVAAGGPALRIQDLGGPDGHAVTRKPVRLSAAAGTRSVEVTFFIDGRVAGSTTLPMPGTR
jgi:hypothetical protein